MDIKKNQALILVAALVYVNVVFCQTPAGNNQEVQFNNNGSFGSSPYLKWDGTSLKFLDLGSHSAKLYFSSENGDNSYIFSENYGSNLNRLVFHTRDDGNQDYAVFRNRHWNDGEKDVFEIHRSWTMANSHFYVMNGNLGVGTKTPESSFEVEDKSLGANVNDEVQIVKVEGDRQFFKIIEHREADGSNWNNTTIKLQAGVDATNHQSIDFVSDGSYQEHIDIFTGNQLFNSRFTSDGKLGIGTSNPDEKLSVNGNIHTKEVRVDLTGWSDFVFEENYDLPTLTEVENHIEENGHLKDIPSAAEVSENGILLGQMDAKLLQKIEELMLYTIQQQKEIEELKNQINELKQQ